MRMGRAMAVRESRRAEHDSRTSGQASEFGGHEVIANREPRSANQARGVEPVAVVPVGEGEEVALGREDVRREARRGRRAPPAGGEQRGHDLRPLGARERADRVGDRRARAGVARDALEDRPLQRGDARQVLRRGAASSAPGGAAACRGRRRARRRAPRRSCASSRPGTGFAASAQTTRTGEPAPRRLARELVGLARVELEGHDLRPGREQLGEVEGLAARRGAGVEHARAPAAQLARGEERRRAAPPRPGPGTGGAGRGSDRPDPPLAPPRGRGPRPTRRRGRGRRARGKPARRRAPPRGRRRGARRGPATGARAAPARSWRGRGRAPRPRPSQATHSSAIQRGSASAAATWPAGSVASGGGSGARGARERARSTAFTYPAARPCSTDFASATVSPTAAWAGVPRWRSW